MLSISELQFRGINPKIFRPDEETWFIHLLCIQWHSLQEVSEILNMTGDEVRKQLRVETMNIRDRKKGE